MSEAGARQFYGGEPLTGAAGGEVGGHRHYSGSEATIEAPWKCPACGQPNESPLKFGCVHCGSGKPGVHVGVQQPVPPVNITAKRAAVQPGFEQKTDAYFDDWLRGLPRLPDTATIEFARRAYHAGWIDGALNQARATLATAPPVTADVEQLAPAGKPRRTIVAALELFRDQVLPTAEEEIASGEWCSRDEVEALIAQLREEEL